jgi:hypothetical protein
MPSKTSEFSKDLYEMMMSADITLHKLNNQHLRKFLERYTNQHIPSETPLQKNYVTACYQDVLNNIRSCIAGVMRVNPEDEMIQFETC